MEDRNLSGVLKMTKTAVQAAPKEAMDCARTLRLVRPSTSRIEEDRSSDGCDIGAGGGRQTDVT